MLPKKLKLPIGSFPKSSKIIISDNSFIIRAAPNTLGYNRLGVTFKSKAFKTAVQRNKLKRQVFNSFREALKERLTKENKGKDLLIILNPPIIGLTREELTQKLKQYASTI